MGLLDDFKNLPDAKVLAATSRGGRFTAADVSARAGCSLEEAKQALTAATGLLGGAGAALEVSTGGDLVFCLPPQPAQLLAAQSQAAALRAQADAAKPQLYTALRVAFGVGLLVSLAAVYSAIFFISTSSSEGQRDDRRDRRDDRGLGGGGGFGGGFGPSLYFGPSPFDVFYYRPYYGYGGRAAAQGPPQMGLLEAVYSYVFGDGNPNANLDARAVAAAARAIRAQGGAVTAQQLLPFVPAPPTGQAGAAQDADRAAGLGRSAVVDEQYVLPIVTRLQGVAQVTAAGGIVYTFDDLVVTAASAADEAADDNDVDFAYALDDAQRLGYLDETPSAFTAATGLNAFLAPALGALNLVGALYLGVQLASLPEGAILPGAFGLIQGLYPLLVAYALAFNAAPALRAAQLPANNAAVDARNAARRNAAASLASPTAETRAQLAAARQMGAGGAKRVGGGVGDVAFSTDDRGVAQLEAAKRAGDLGDFDRRLGQQ